MATPSSASTKERIILYFNFGLSHWVTVTLALGVEKQVLLCGEKYEICSFARSASFCSSAGSELS